MEDMQAAEQIVAEDETDLLDLFLEWRYEELLVTVDAEWDRKDRKDLPSSAAIAAITAARLGRHDEAIEWLARSPTSDLTRADHLLLADANLSLGRVEDAQRHRSASATATAPDDEADFVETLEVVVAARLGEELGTLEPLTAERLAAAEARDWTPDRFAAEWLVRDGDWAAALAVGEWAAAAGRPWATEPDFWLTVATFAAGSGRSDLVVRALESRTGLWAPEFAQQGDFLLAGALIQLGERARAAEAASRAARLEGPLQDRAACLAHLYACDPADLHCQFDALKAYWKLIEADGEPDPAERTDVGAGLLRIGTNDPELGRLALELVGSVAPSDPLAPLAKLALGFVAFYEQRYEEALSHLDTVDLSDDVPTQHNVTVARAVALLGLDRVDEALAASAKARELRMKFGAAMGTPQQILPLDLVILARAARWSDLADAARLAMSSDVPDNEQQEAQRWLLIALVELGDLEGAVTQARSMAEEQDETNADLAARITVANVCQIRGKLDEALVLLGDDVPEASHQLRLQRWLLCFTVAERQGDMDTAIEALRGAALLDADSARLLAYYLALYHPDDAKARPLESLTDPGDDPPRRRCSSRLTYARRFSNQGSMNFSQRPSPLSPPLLTGCCTASRPPRRRPTRAMRLPYDSCLRPRTSDF
jgi:tetratricopeptide (TPR) repeat protein